MFLQKIYKHIFNNEMWINFKKFYALFFIIIINKFKLGKKIKISNYYYIISVHLIQIIFETKCNIYKRFTQN